MHTNIIGGKEQSEHNQDRFLAAKREKYTEKHLCIQVNNVLNYPNYGLFDP